MLYLSRFCIVKSVKRGLILRLFFILALAVGAIYIDLPKQKGFSWKGIERDLKIHRGLDLEGGTRLVYEADLSKVETKRAKDAIQSIVNIVDRRINALGVSEPLIQSTQIGGKNGVVVELPGVKNVQEAIDLIGKTAQLEFHEEAAEAAGANGFAPGWNKTGLTGADLTNANLNIETSPTKQLTRATLKAEPVVQLKFNGEGAKKFGEITKRNMGKRIAIVIDDRPISAPTVQQAIETGDAVITGLTDAKEAKNLAIALQAGALPVPIKLVAQSTIGPTLGQQAVRRSIVAGLFGLALVAVFMIVYYRLAGIAAVVALLIYGIIVVALFKIVPVTLTLAGITAFILSIGMAVDANILIFERLKEERRKGKPLALAIDEGFTRAWSSIRDSNVSSVITAAILFWFGSSAIRGFALTLILGILVSMFTAITVSRILLKFVLKEKKI